MTAFFRTCLVGLLVFATASGRWSPQSTAWAQSLGAERFDAAGTRAPRIRLDKSPKIVQYQLRRLSTDQLLSIPRSATETKYLLVYREILIRAGIAPKIREESLAAIQSLGSQSTVEVLCESIRDADMRRQGSSGPLIGLLLRQPDLADQQQLIADWEHDANPTVRSAVRLVQTQCSGVAVTWDRFSDQGKLDLLARVELLDSRQREELLPWLARILVEDQSPDALEAAAMRALAHISADPRQRMELALRGMHAANTQSAAVAVIGSIAPADFPPDVARVAIDALSRAAEETPKPQRGNEEFLRLMECAGNLTAALPEAESRAWRRRLARIAVRVIRVQTVLDQMRYDKPYFVVEQSEDFLLIFHNQDMMPHNLVITAPGALREIGLAASSLLPTSPTKKQYVPDSDLVLAATDMLLPRTEARLVLTAPSAAGEYPFVCTFPNHWYRMYGVMLVVRDLDAWLQTPVPPADPLGITRRLVKHWTVDDIDQLLSAAPPADESTLQQGAAIFAEAGCVKCHRVNCQGSTVGPALDGVLQRHDGERRSLLRELVDPAYAVADQYANYAIELRDGGIVSGLVTQQTEKSVTVISNPEDPQAMELPRAEIEQMVRLNVSLMPSGLLDQYTQEEIRAVLAYIERAEGEAPVESQTPAD